MADELERRTYRYSYTPVLEVEVEYARKETTETTENKITGVDFGIVERPKSVLTLDQDISKVKVTLSDGITVLIDTEKNIGTEHLAWIAKGNKKVYDKKELMNIIMDGEITNGATIEIEYYLTVTNNSNLGTGTTRAKNILNYVANNLNFNGEDITEIDGKVYKNKDLWTVVSKDSVQNDTNASFVNKEIVDLSTQSVILQTTEGNPLTKNLAPGEQVTATLKLNKVLSTEGSQDDLTFTNMSEIVEIENTFGRYDHEATPGNQKLEEQPMEHDTSGASNNTLFDNLGQPDEEHPQDGTIKITPPTGSTHIYYVIGIVSVIVLALGIILIKKFVIDEK